MLVLIAMLLSNTLLAQLTASFTVNKESGCKPLTAQFSNTTTGAGANVVYSWNFGNGNTSALANPGATFIEEKTYTVTLTATSGGTSSTATRQITVYKTPTLDFAATPTKGCMPLEVGFTANATPGDGTISKYAWDFGDGQTAEGTNLIAPKHTYTFAQLAPVSLTVTNSFGCFNSRNYGGMINVFQSIKADFTFNPVRTCTPADVVKFQNNSTVTPGTTWLWEFGDGKTNSEKSPDHVYNKEGNYLVKLTATSPDGCTSVKVSDTLRVGNIQLDFNLPESICQNERIALNHGISPPYTAIRWNANTGYMNQDIYSSNSNYTAYDFGKVDITLEVDFGNCKVNRTKELTVNPKIGEKSFAKKKLNTCIIPAAYEFADTTQIGAKWSWTISPLNQVLGTDKSFRYEFKDSGGYAQIKLEVTTDKGCTSTVQDTVIYGFDEFKIVSNISPIFDAGTTCTGVSHSFSLFSPFDGDRRVVSCIWDFGDGVTSTIISPDHTFTEAGEYQVKATFTTEDGCSRTVYFPIKITVNNRPKVWIEVEGGNTICGNTPTKIYIKSDPGFSFVKTEFDKDGRSLDLYPAGGFVYQFFEPGDYNATVYAFWGQHCKDTISFDKVVKVLPPINYPMAPINTCDGDRLTVEFKDSSKQAEKWKWDFGDGTSQEFAGIPGKLLHHYEKTGKYLAKLTTTTGNCSVTDSVKVYVWKKQYPVLSFNSEKVCANAFTPYILNGYESSPAPYPYTVNSDYSNISGQYTDTSFPLVEDPIITLDFIRALEPGKTGFRFLLTTSYFDCEDTTNFAKIEFRGPVANFETPRENGYCLSDRVILADSSKAFPGVPISRWEWRTSEGNFSFSNGFSYLYNNPSPYGIGLEIEDAEGCTSFKGQDFRVYGPKSTFTASSQNVALGTTVQFTNTTSYYPDYTNPNWILPNGNASSNYNESFTFNEEGEYYVKLFHELAERGCKDTAIRKIIVRKVNAKFTHSISYVNNNGCPPAIVRFTSTATNAVRYGWNFGNGAIGGNSTTVTHTYTQPGLYQVWHYSYDENNNVDSSFDFIEIKGPYALIAANRLSACNNLEVTLSAEVKNANGFVWDLGDGTISSNPQTQITHQYLTAGIYSPSLILEDAAGCKATSILPEKIIVDSLNGNFIFSPTKICAGSNVLFTGAPQSFSATQLGSTLAYNWQVAGSNNVGQVNTYNHTFSNQGNYAVTLTLASEYGCTKIISKTVTIEPALNAAISAATQICVGDTTSFRASATGIGVQFRWYIPGQPLITSANTNTIPWNTAGTYNISLAADNGACIDSVVHVLTVNALPVIVFNPTNPRICLGDSTILTVQGTDTYTWQPQSSLQAIANGSTRVWPASDTWYHIKALSAAGCSSSDSIGVTVVQPFNLVTKSSFDACLGQTVNLTATGANRYQWIPATGLTNAAIADPVANITASRTYSLIGFDAFGCFTDTAMVQINIHPQPLVNAGLDTAVLSGNAVQLNALSSLPNVIWKWEPATYLSCTNCANPMSRPLSNMVYTATATTNMGCSATDTIQVKVLCAADRLFIPSGFTPNGDGLNDRFGILGGGFSKIKHFRITNRWGNTLFERINVLPTDPSATWNGNYADGKAATLGTYIYAIEVECVTGETFSYKGIITLIR